MADHVNQKAGQEGQNNIAAFLQGLPDDQLGELRKAAGKEMKRRGIVSPRKQGEGGKQKRRASQAIISARARRARMDRSLAGAEGEIITVPPSGISPRRTLARRA